MLPPKSIVYRAIATFLLPCILILFNACDQTTTPRVLVFSKTKGWKHTSIPFGIDAIYNLGRENGFLVDTTKNAEFFDDYNLKQYHAVIFNNTTRNVLNAEQQAAFERYIQAGGGYVGIHAAADTEYEWPWYDKLVGAHFSSHPHNPNVRKAVVTVTDTTHLSTKGLPVSWERTDEWYNYRSFYPGIKVLAYLDESTYEGGTNGSNHPISWFHEFDGGRAFYTGLGHTDSSFSEPMFLKHILGGIQYAMGNGKLDYRKAYAVAVPEENRFVKTVLVNDLDTPMELAVAPDGRVFYTELRSANLSVYDTKTNKNTLVHQFNVATKGGTGLIGVTLDPAFESNHFIYIYYSPPAEKEPIIFNLSRFRVNDDNTLDLASEKVLLEVPVQENSGAHHGGSLAWDKDGNLFLSTGDSSSPFPSNGYAPIDERPGPEFYSLDAQRSAANTNDLKGKVLRIHPEPDGTYTIPEGNLFRPGTEKTRAEIYAMGCRNPYRIAVNPKTSVLYWGEIGPDAGKDSIQGPRGYDEFNQAKKAGNFGWPYFVGNNQAYFKWDFATNTPGALFNPESPVNNSPNNTGLSQLPPALPAMIWYPYAASEKFPELGQGGRSAMAGEFYTFDRSSSSVKFPAYYDGALFVFDWMRNWILALRFDGDENYLKSEPFMTANGDFRRPIDLAFGRDGVMYMLEYGSVYGADNDDARLVKIEYSAGNRSPVAKAGIVDSAASALIDRRVFLTSERALPPRKEVAGEVPLRVLFTSRGTNDPDDNDTFHYEWMFDGKTVGSTVANPTYTYDKPGMYQAVLRVKDQSGATGTDTVLVKAGNSPPEISIQSQSNKSFYWDNKVFRYTVKATDKEDGSVDPKDVAVFYEYRPKPGTANVPAGQSAALPLGYTLIANSDCKACHTIDKISVGPSYRAVAEKYKGQPGSVSTLSKKIISGGGGNWGKEHVMAAHPQISSQDANEMVRYILSLADAPGERTPIGLQGTLRLNEHKEDEPQGVYMISATYQDKGHNGIGPLTGGEVVILRNAKIKTVYADAYTGFRRFGNNLSGGNHKSYLLFRNIDLTGIRGLTYEYASASKDGSIEVRIDSQAGPVIARTPYSATGGWDAVKTVSGTFDTSVSGRHDVYIVVVRNNKPNDDIINLKFIRFDQ